MIVGLFVALSSPAQQGSPPLSSVSLLDAVQSALAKHPQVRIDEQQMAIAKALKQQASSAFDEVQQFGVNHSRIYTPLLRSPGAEAWNNLDNQTDLQVGVRRLLRNGISIAPSIALSRLTGNSLNHDGTNQSEVGVRVNLPLLRGRGSAVVASEERAATAEVDAAALDLQQTLSAVVMNVVSSYWKYVAAQNLLDVAVGSESRGKTLAENVTALIDAGQSARSELSNAAANVSDRQASRIAAQQNVVEARIRCGFDMGLDPGEIQRTAFAATDGLPDPVDQPLSDPGYSARPFIDQALRLRADYRAARLRIDEAEILRVGASNLLRPQLDFRLEMGYAGLTQGRAPLRLFAAFGERVNGANVIGGFTFEMPRGNRLGIGKVTQADAQFKQAQMRAGELAREIVASVTAGLEAIRNAILRVQRARDSVRQFQAALQDERDKLNLGMGSIVSILTVEDRLTAASQNEVQARLAYALALVQFRYATGALISAAGGAATIRRDVLVSMPSVSDSEGRL